LKPRNRSTFQKIEMILQQ